MACVAVFSVYMQKKIDTSLSEVSVLKMLDLKNFVGRFEIVWHNINPIKTSVYCEILYKAMNETTH